MITHIYAVSVFLADQDRALPFYTDKLGFKLRVDQPMGPLSYPLQIKVLPSNGQTALVLYKPTKEMLGASTYEEAQSIIGSFLPFIFRVDDMELLYKTLSAKGIEFPTVPANNTMVGGQL